MNSSVSLCLRGSNAVFRINWYRGNPGCAVCQRGYFERVIRDDRELAAIREYIVTNPLRWSLDKENPIHTNRTPTGDTDMLKYLLSVFFTVVVLSLPLPVQPAYGAPLRVGSPPPEVSLPGLAGGSVRIPGDFQGKVAIIHFWSTGCSTTCRDEMAAMETLYATYRNRGLAVVVVNVGQKANEVKEFLKAVNQTYRVALDTDRKAALLYDSVDLPRTFILDKKGLIRYKLIGGASEGTLKKMVLSLL